MIRFDARPISDEALPLWLICFTEDGQEEIRALLSLLSEDGVMLSAADGEKAVAQALLLPLTLDGREGYYLYAVGTHPDYRGRGYMRACLLAAREYAEERKKDFLILIPATAQLGDTYRHAGFTVELPLSADERGEHPVYRLQEGERLLPFDGDLRELYRRYGGECSFSLFCATLLSLSDTTRVWYTEEGGFCVLSREGDACFLADRATLSRCKTSKSPYRALLCPLSPAPFTRENADPLPR